MSAKKILVIGGSAAGPKAAARARRLCPDGEITILQKGAYLSMASCGYPYYVGGTFTDRDQLISTPTGVIRDPDFFSKTKGINALTKTEALKIEPDRHTVECRDLNTEEVFTIEYDKLIIATGTTPLRPPVPGTDLEGITTLQSMEDAERLRNVASEKTASNAVVVGGGRIGVETCEALTLAEDVRNIGLIVSPMPASLSSTVMTRRFGGDPDFAVQTAILTTLLSIITVPLWIWILHRRVL